jgi:plasmid replication initiation protein
MSNHIVNAAQSLNLSEKRLVSVAMAKLDSLAKTFPAKPIRITAIEYAECFGINERTAYDQLKKGGETLYNRDIKRVHKTDKGDRVQKIRWVSSLEYQNGAGFVQIRFTPEVAPYLVDLKKRFTTYKLEQTRALRSMHSWRLYENLKRWETTGKWIVEIDDFHRVMESSKSYQENFAQLRKWVIEPAVKELRAVNNLEIEWRAWKTGRKVTRLVFIFEPAAQMQMKLEENDVL